MKKTVEHKTANGIVKGRPGAGHVLSLGERKTCYHGHKMTKDNTFAYTRPRHKLDSGRVDPKDKPIERQWCRTCRAQSRKGSRVRHDATVKAESRLVALKARETAEAGMTKGKARKASSARPAAAKGKPKAAPAPKARKAAPAPKAKASAKTRATSAKMRAAQHKPAPKGKASPRSSKGSPVPEIAGSTATARKAARVAATAPPSGNTAGGG